ncbi:SDR family oxidoreductase [Polyangium jinanense]|uniref:NAD(P)H-binding protein n=1 Tax=Polyangium jinanense TaxID=2829994 RepID=A0A9X3XE85_9BACT|nr:NAD(P)H-binding protein [Polyangium jinanense]MDC3960998.1 NAD(P)H-binding protein [Polyangium jinanense]MDC3987418.1 NAD(P)H-binding protein [Polyangium jinanense]
MNILVTGATGTVGREIVKQLVEGGHHVRALSRNPARAHFPAGVHAVAGDLTAPDTFAEAFEGIEALHLINFGGDDSAPLETGARIVALAERAGVRRITVLLGGAPAPLDEAVAAGSIDWTFLQPVEFMANHLEWAASIRSEGLVREPFPDRLSAVVHEADIAAVAVAALTQDGHAGKTYTLTGPEVLSLRQKVDILAAAAKREINLVELTEQQARERWQGMGFSPEAIEFFVYIYGNTPEIGYTVTPTVEQVTGRRARTFAQWAAEHASAFTA